MCVARVQRGVVVVVVCGHDGHAATVPQVLRAHDRARWNQLVVIAGPFWAGAELRRVPRATLAIALERRGCAVNDSDPKSDLIVKMNEWISSVMNAEAHAMAAAERLWPLEAEALAQVYSWGANGGGQLGQGNRAPRDRPSPVHWLAGRDIASASAGFDGDCCFATSRAGFVYAWGGCGHVPLGTVPPLSAGRSASWKEPSYTRPCRVEGLEGRPGLRVYAGTHHAFAVDADGVLFTWGQNGHGQLGVGETERGSRALLVTRPMPSPALSEHVFTRKTIAVVATGPVCSGAATGALCARPWNVIHRACLRVLKLVNMVALVIWLMMSAVDGELYMWGSAANGRLGLGDATYARHGVQDEAALLFPAPCLIASFGIHRVTMLAVGAVHILCVADGHVWAWGDGHGGRLGLGMGSDKVFASPTRVAAFDGMEVIALAAATWHSLAGVYAPLLGWQCCTDYAGWYAQLRYRCRIRPTNPTRHLETTSRRNARR